MVRALAQAHRLQQPERLAVALLGPGVVATVGLMLLNAYLLGERLLVSAMRDGGPQLAAEIRTVLGKKVRFLRRQGMTPGNIFGHAVDSTAIQLSTREIEHALSHVPRTF